MGACCFCRIARLQEAQSRKRWGHAGSAASLGTAHALSLDVRLGPPGLGSLRVRCASPSWLRLLPQPARGHGQPLAVDLRKPNRVSDGGMLVLLHRSGLPMPSRWTFASAFPASALCVSAALRRAPIRRRRIGRGFACRRARSRAGASLRLVNALRSRVTVARRQALRGCQLGKPRCANAQRGGCANRIEPADSSLAAPCSSLFSVFGTLSASETVEEQR